MPYKITLPTGETVEAKRVTEVIRAGMPRPALQEWELRAAVEYALLHRHISSALDVIAAWRRTHARHANRGTAVHKWIAATCRDTPAPALLASQKGYKDAWWAWVVDKMPFGGALIEQTLCNDDKTIAGTADLIVEDILVDYKTVEKKGDTTIWPDHVAQLGGYSSMRYVVDAKGRATEWAPEINEARIVRLCSDGSYDEKVLRGHDLERARDLWLCVQVVARYTTANNRAEQKERE